MNLILLLISNSTNSRLLTELLKPHHQVLLFKDEPDLDKSFDLCIIDGVYLSHYSQKIRERIDREKPLFLPVILLTNKQQINRSTVHLWEMVDDLLVIPVEKVELLARVETLLRSRRLSLDLKQVKQELKDSQIELQQLKEELEQMNRLFPEE